MLKRTYNTNETNEKNIRNKRNVKNNRNVWLTKKLLYKPAVYYVFWVFILSFFISSILPIMKTKVFAADNIVFEMNVNLNDYANDIKDSIYYAWRGKVNLTGDIAITAITNTSINAYLDSNIDPVFSINTTLMTQSNSRYYYSVTIDTTEYKRGYHTLRIYNGEVTSFVSDTPILNVPVYIDYAEAGTIYNVTSSCNMRESATTLSDIVTAVPLGADVEILGQVTGERISQYNTNIWYFVRYENGESVSNGYILSTFIKKRTTGISKMQANAADSVISEFFPDVIDYHINLPYSSFDLKVNDLVMYNKADTLKVMLNGVEAQPPYLSLPLITGDNKVEFICNSAADSSSITYTYTIWRIAQTTESEFKAQLAKFPESYKPGLLVLHSKYPKWLFTAFNTNLDWEDVIDREDSGSVSLIGKGSPAEYKYSEVILDGNSFVRASRAAVEYYVDPRNFFDEKLVFQFEQLSYQTNNHVMAGITTLLTGSGLAGRETLFMNAAKASGVSPYHLAARSKQEVTVWSPSIGLSSLANGKYTGANGIYNGIYNFYNIGTGSGTIDYIIWRGLNFAKGNNFDGTVANYFLGSAKSDTDRAKYNLPWNTEANAITGGAKYIGATYINQGQDTLYLQKFDVDPIYGLYSHQYMQNVQAPSSEALNSYKAYATKITVNNLQPTSLTNSFAFRIPVYLKMPSLAAPKPEDTNKLTTLEVQDFASKANFNITPAFDPSKEQTYSITVPAVISKITILSTTLNSNARIIGTGDMPLVFGSNNRFIVSCTPKSGAKRDYTITITRSFPVESSDNFLSTISISAGTAIAINPVFNPDNPGPYTATIPDNASQITIGAMPHYDKASVAGTGLKTIEFGTTLLQLAVTAENGSIKNYTLSLTRNIPKLKSSLYTINNGLLSGVEPSSNVDSLKKRLDATVAQIRIFNSAGKEITGTTLIGTGMKIRVYYEDKIIEEVTALIFGDVNGDGKINSTDITTLKRHILKLNPLTGKLLSACDVNKDGKYNSTDYTIMKRHILKLQDIKQK